MSLINISRIFFSGNTKDVLDVIKEQTISTFNQATSESQVDLANLNIIYKETIQKINRLEERFIEEEIGTELYHKYHDKYNKEKEEIEQKLHMLSKQVSNLEKVVDKVLKFATQLPLKWVSADYYTKQKYSFYSFLMASIIARKLTSVEPQE